MACKVVNVRKEMFDVYIGRPHRHFPVGSKFANKFNISPERTRQQAIDAYSDWLWAEIRAGRITVKELAALDGQTLGCWCDPLPCHGHVLAEAVKWAVEEIKKEPCCD